MKSKNLILTAILMAVSSTMMAQENIEKAFDALRQSRSQEETYSNHFLEKDPDTGLMEGMSDEYEFKTTYPDGKRLVTAIRQAFDKDEQAAYSVSTGSHGGAENYTSLAVGNGNKGGVAIGLMKDSKWIRSRGYTQNPSVCLCLGVGREEGRFHRRTYRQDVCYDAEIQTEKVE